MKDRIQIQQLSKTFFIKKDGYPKEMIQILAHDKGNSGDLYVCYTEVDENVRRDTSDKSVFDFSILSDPYTYDDWNKALEMSLWAIGEKRFGKGQGESFQKKALAVIPVALFMFCWDTLNLLRKDPPKRRKNRRGNNESR